MRSGSLPWHSQQSTVRGISCAVPRASSTPSSTKNASFPDGSHAYAANNQSSIPGPNRWMSRVSTATPSARNSFQKRAPTGSDQ